MVGYDMDACTSCPASKLLKSVRCEDLVQVSTWRAGCVGITEYCMPRIRLLSSVLKSRSYSSHRSLRDDYDNERRLTIIPSHLCSPASVNMHETSRRVSTRVSSNKAVGIESSTAICLQDLHLPFNADKSDVLSPAG